MFGIKRDKTDALFSDYIRIRDGWTCQKCFTKYTPPTTGLQCSHFFGRGWKSVRWDPENAIALCAFCHTRVSADPVGHAQIFLKRLGRRAFDMLTVRAHNPKNMDAKMCRIWLKALIEGERQKISDQVIGYRPAKSTALESA